MKKVLFIDRDGTLVLEPSNYQLDSFDKLIFYPEVFKYLGKIVDELDYLLVMVTNQDGLGTDSFPENSFHPIHDFILQSFKQEGVNFDRVFIDRSFPEENSPLRKPKTGLLKDYLDSNEYDMGHSFVIGDRLTDMELAQNLNAKGLFITNDLALGEDEVTSFVEKTIVLKTKKWEDIYDFLKLDQRIIIQRRTTNETDISLTLNLDGTGKSKIDTGIDFFDHMLDQIAHHGNIDIELKVEGDLEVDEHHTIEDTGIVLGEAFKKSLGDKFGIERYGFCLPMDDCLAQVAIDFGGRNWLVWETKFKREMIGKMPTEMFFHFFYFFTDGAKVNLNIKAEGSNEHHKIEAIFKAFAKAIKYAIKRDSNKMILPSTKGSF